jgi:hypothetical protein
MKRGNSRFRRENVHGAMPKLSDTPTVYQKDSEKTRDLPKSKKTCYTGLNHFCFCRDDNPNMLQNTCFMAKSSLL